MAITAYNQNTSRQHHLANWLIVKSTEDSMCSQITYHTVGRAALIGESLFSLAEAVVRIFIGRVALIGYVFTIGCWEQVKDFGENQFQISEEALTISFDCVRSLNSPRELIHHLIAI